MVASAAVFDAASPVASFAVYHFYNQVSGEQLVQIAANLDAAQAKLDSVFSLHLLGDLLLAPENSAFP
jgi:hypothetical protein